MLRTIVRSPIISGIPFSSRNIVIVDGRADNRRRTLVGRAKVAPAAESPPDRATLRASVLSTLVARPPELPLDRVSAPRDGDVEGAPADWMLDGMLRTSEKRSLS